MKITKNYLKNVIAEELESMKEVEDDRLTADNISDDGKKMVEEAKSKLILALSEIRKATSFAAKLGVLNEQEYNQLRGIQNIGKLLEDKFLELLPRPKSSGSWGSGTTLSRTRTSDRSGEPSDIKLT